MCAVLERLVRVTAGQKYRTGVVIKNTGEAAVRESPWRPHRTLHRGSIEKCHLIESLVYVLNITPIADADACKGPRALVIISQRLSTCEAKQGGKGCGLKKMPPRT